jgi:hypothetical protein
MTHVACVFDGSIPEIRLYVDGVLASSKVTVMDLALVARLNAFVGASSYPNDPKFNGFVDELRIYDLALTDQQVATSFARGPDAEFEGPPPSIEIATVPEPNDGTTDHPVDLLLKWKPGEHTILHNVYVGTSFEDVNNGDPSVLLSEQQLDPEYPLTQLEYSTTYYWRIDEFKDANTVYPGNIWSFSTMPIGLIIPQESITVTASSEYDPSSGPGKTIDGSGLVDNLHSTNLLDMWLSNATTEPNKAWIQYDLDRVYKVPRMLIWNFNNDGYLSDCAIKEVMIEYSADGGQSWTLLADVNELPMSPLTEEYPPIIVDLGGVADGIAANSFRITAINNWGENVLPAFGLSEVKFYYIPIWPTEPSPADGAVQIPIDGTVLSWTPGEYVANYIVYMGTDEIDVISGAAPSYQTTAPSLPVQLELGNTYFWRVEANDMGTIPQLWSGPTWSFASFDYKIVDDFEGCDISNCRWTTVNTASVSLDQTIVRNGQNSLKFNFNDLNPEGYCEAGIDNLGSRFCGTDWSGLNYLIFWIYGDANNVNTETMYVDIEGVRYKNIVSVNSLRDPSWTQVTLELNPMYFVDIHNIRSLYFGFQRKILKGEAKGFIYIDDIRLYSNLPTP